MLKFLIFILIVFVSVFIAAAIFPDKDILGKTPYSQQLKSLFLLQADNSFLKIGTVALVMYSVCVIITLAVNKSEWNKPSRLVYTSISYPDKVKNESLRAVLLPDTTDIHTLYLREDEVTVIVLPDSLSAQERFVLTSDKSRYDNPYIFCDAFLTNQQDTLFITESNFKRLHPDLQKKANK